MINFTDYYKQMYFSELVEFLKRIYRSCVTCKEFLILIVIISVIITIISVQDIFN